MKIGQFCKEYTDPELRTGFLRVLDEVGELIGAIFTFDADKIKDEFADVLVLTQIWLYYKHKVDNDLWGGGMSAYSKIMSRRKYWNQIYDFVGLNRTVSYYCGNYLRKRKVVSQLGRFGISKERALEAYEKIVN